MAMKWNLNIVSIIAFRASVSFVMFSDFMPEILNADLVSVARKPVKRNGVFSFGHCDEATSVFFMSEEFMAFFCS